MDNVSFHIAPSSVVKRFSALAKSLQQIFGDFPEPLLIYYRKLWWRVSPFPEFDWKIANQLPTNQCLGKHHRLTITEPETRSCRGDHAIRRIIRENVVVARSAMFLIEIEIPVRTRFQGSEEIKWKNLRMFWFFQYSFLAHRCTIYIFSSRENENVNLRIIG